MGARGWGGGREGYGEFNGYRVSVLPGERVLELDYIHNNVNTWHY